MKQKLIKILISQIFFIACLLLFIAIALFIIFCLSLSLTFKLNGDDYVEISYNTEYKDEGTNNFLNFNTKKESTVDTSKVGEYKIKYSINILFVNIYKYRTVKVVDKVNPEIILNGDLKRVICPDYEDEEEGYTAFDEYDGDISLNVLRDEVSDGISYKVSDSSNNEATVFREIIKEDNEPPKISLKGNSKIYVKVSSKYSDSGFNVTDNCDNYVSVVNETNLNIDKVGTYYYKYIAKDKSGNESEVSRSIIVYKEEGTGVIYLTFDDGPSKTSSTQKILNILKEEGVLATFFVTANGNMDLIKDEYYAGHTVALHTNSHEYSYVYSSVENYFNDLTAIENKVYDLIGIRPKIIRFPGGSNNTVSNRYNSGIMNILKKEVVNRGYNYFDWNVSSGDAGRCTTSSCVYNTTIKGLSKSRENVVLMHDIKMFTADALSDIIHYAKANGYTFKKIENSTSSVRFK